MLWSKRIDVEHLTIISAHPFAEVRARLEAELPKLDQRMVENLTGGELGAVNSSHEVGPLLSIFLERDHGTILTIVGQARHAIQYEIGNPLTASKMTRHRLAAALYAPLRVVLYEDDKGRAVIEYDQPSSLFGQYGDERVTEVGRSLDTALGQALARAVV